MLTDAKNAELIPEWAAYIEAESTREAFLHLVGLAAGLRSFNCHAQRKGEVRDFRFYQPDSNIQPLAFIVNQHSLLFYFRRPAVESGSYRFNELQRQFESATENNRGEWTVRLQNVDDVRRLWRYLNIE